MATSSKANNGRYVDGFVIAVPKKNLGAYRRMAAAAGKIWRKYGAIDYKECVGDDLTPQMGEYKLAQFPVVMKAKPGETIVFSYIVFKSRAHRDKVNAKVMKDPFMNQSNYKDQPMPFDMKRMAYGGFKVIVNA